MNNTSNPVIFSEVLRRGTNPHMAYAQIEFYDPSNIKIPSNKFTVNKSSNYSESNYPTRNLYDNNLSTWLGTTLTDNNPYITFIFTVPLQIKRIKLYWRKDCYTGRYENQTFVMLV